MANSLTEAIKKESDVPPSEAWKDEKQPEEPKDQIGFRLDGDGFYYSPYLKKRKKRKK